MHFYSSTMYLQMISSAFLLPDNQVYIFPAFYLSPTPQGRNVYLPPQNFVLIIYLSRAYLFSLKISINWKLFIFFLLANLSITLSTQSETLVKAVLVLRVLSEDEVILHPFQLAVFDFQRLYYPVQ